MTFAHRVAAALALGLVLFAAPALAAGKFEYAGKFDYGSTEVDLGKYVDTNDAGVESRVGLVGVRVGTSKNSAAFDSGEWPTLLDLWAKAQTLQSDTWVYVGDFTETGPSDVSHLKVDAGPGVRIIIESPAKGAFTVEIKRSDMPSFSAALLEVKAFLNGG